MALQMRKKDQLAFYAEYLASKTVFTWFEVKSPRIQVFAYDMAWMIGRVLKKNRPNAPKFFDATEIDTIHGRLKVRPNTVDFLAASPSFERADRREMLRVVGQYIQSGKTVLFVDVGSGVGDYAVSVGTKYARSGQLRMLSVEPMPESARLTRENLVLNGLDHITTVAEVALFDKDGEDLHLNIDAEDVGSSAVVDDDSSGSIIVKSARLDTIIDGLDEAFDVVVMKIDVEGAEEYVLRGATRTLERYETMVMLEDFVRPSITDYVSSVGADLVKKVTPYNSWWKWTVSTPVLRPVPDRG